MKHWQFFEIIAGLLNSEEFLKIKISIVKEATKLLNRCPAEHEWAPLFEQQRSYIRERNKSAAQFFWKEHKVSAAHKN